MSSQSFVKDKFKLNLYGLIENPRKDHVEGVFPEYASPVYWFECGPHLTKEADSGPH